MTNSMTRDCVVRRTEIAADKTRENFLKESNVEVESTRITSNEENVKPLALAHGGMLEQSRLMESVGPYTHNFL